MAVSQQGSNIVIDASIEGSAFPMSEKELVFPVLVDGSERHVVIGGALYGRSVVLHGNVTVNGPIVARGDTRLDPGAGRIQLGSGLTINGSLNGAPNSASPLASMQDGVQNAMLIIKGDVCVNQNVSLRNAIVFGSIRAVNCSLENTLVLGTCIVDESLKVTMSSIGGYAARDIEFAGHCVLLHALGESRSRPLFVPHEEVGGRVLACDLRYYPAIRGSQSLMSRLGRESVSYPAYSQLYPETDWVPVQATANSALDEWQDGAMEKWVLSIGGRIGDISKIAGAVSSLTQMLKCGFEYEHYHHGRRAGLLAAALNGLTDEEQWILKTVCH